MGIFSRLWSVLPPPNLPQVGGGNCSSRREIKLNQISYESKNVVLNLFQHLINLAERLLACKTQNQVQGGRKLFNGENALAVMYTSYKCVKGIVQNLKSHSQSEALGIQLLLNYDYTNGVQIFKINLKAGVPC